jgi:hypothetical protein
MRMARVQVAPELLVFMIHYGIGSIAEGARRAIVLQVNENKAQKNLLKFLNFTHRPKFRVDNITLVSSDRPLEGLKSAGSCDFCRTNPIGD